MFFNKKKNEEVQGADAPQEGEKKEEGKVKKAIIKGLKWTGLICGGGLLAYGGFRFRGLWDRIGSEVVKEVPDAFTEALPEVAEAATEAVETVVEEQL